MDKSYVTMEQHQCPICYSVFDTGSLLLDNRLRERFDKYTVTGESICPTCQERMDGGYIALIEADEKTRKRLGRVCHIRESVWAQIFNVPAPEGKVAMVPTQVIDMLARAV